jgi:hypothetical protein
MLPMAISKMHVINGFAMLGFTEVQLLFTQLMTNVHHAHSILIPLEMMIDGLFYMAIYNALLVPKSTVHMSTKPHVLLVNTMF